LTKATIYKHFSDLTPTAAKRPAFPSAKHYIIVITDTIIGISTIEKNY